MHARTYADICTLKSPHLSSACRHPISGRKCLFGERSKEHISPIPSAYPLVAHANAHAARHWKSTLFLSDIADFPDFCTIPFPNTLCAISNCTAFIATHFTFVIPIGSLSLSLSLSFSSYFSSSLSSHFSRCKRVISFKDSKTVNLSIKQSIREIALWFMRR